jgi:hypothetical protein
MAFLDVGRVHFPGSETNEKVERVEIGELSLEERLFTMSSDRIDR